MEQLALQLEAADERKRRINREYMRRWRAANPDAAKARGAQWYAENRDHVAEYSKAYRAENCERVAEKKKAWAEANKERRAQWTREYQAQNQEHRAANRKRWYTENADRERENVKRWRRENPEQLQSFFHNRRARVLAATGSYSGEQWQSLCHSLGNVCLCCGAAGVTLTVDHIVPLSRGGRNDITNLQPLCKKCNSRKHVKTIDYRPEWLREQMEANSDRTQI